MRTLSDTWEFLRRSDEIGSADWVDAVIERLAGEITGALGAEHPVACVVMTGGLVFAGRLLPLLAFPLDLDFVQVGRYGRSASGGAMTWRVEPQLDLRDRTVLLLDDILDEGATLAAVAARLRSLGARRVAVAALVEKSPTVGKALRADFVGAVIPDRFVFGAGMDAYGMWRNGRGLRAVAAV